ncbi:MAG: GntR family transcriptional regulator [Streptosporangiaceae bacterium]
MAEVSRRARGARPCRQMSVSAPHQIPLRRPPGAGEQLPSVRDPAEEYQVSVATVRKAHGPLQAEGLMLAQERLCQRLLSPSCGEVSGGVSRVGQAV